jgi:hypothetical protein
MCWQDLVLTIASLAFLVALVPTVLSGDPKPALTTGVLNAVVSAVIATVYLTLQLWFAAGTTGMNAFLWLVIALQTFSLEARQRRIDL